MPSRKGKRGGDDPRDLTPLDGIRAALNAAKSSR